MCVWGGGGWGGGQTTMASNSDNNTLTSMQIKISLSISCLKLPVQLKELWHKPFYLLHG